MGKNGGTTEQDEQDADVWSRDELIPLEAFKMFKEKQNFSVASVKKICKRE